MKKRFPKIFYFLLCFLLAFEQSGFAQLAGQLDISGYFSGLHKVFTTDKFRPLHLRSIGYDGRNNDLQLILDQGDLKSLKVQEIEDSTRGLLNFFFIGITLPNDSFWVNLRPDSPDNIIDDYLAQTDLGKVLIEADLQLKKDTANFTSPQTAEGKDYWNKLYQKANELFAGENVAIPTLTRPWIVPGEIIIRQGSKSAYVYKATLKVMLEQDYLKGSESYGFKDERLKQLNEYASELIRKNIIPRLTKDVNTAKRYAALRQAYYSLILAQWFKQSFSGKNGGYSQLIDRKDLTGLTSKQRWSKEAYFQAYRNSFQDGEYNIREPVYTPQGQAIRTYMSGGIALGPEISAAIGQGQISSAKELPSDLLKNNIVLDYSGADFKIGNLPEGPVESPVVSAPETVKEEGIPNTSSSSPIVNYREFINTPEGVLALAADSRGQIIKEWQRLADQITKDYSEDGFHENMGLIIGTKEGNAYRINRLRPITEFEEGTNRDYLIPSTAQVIRVIENELGDGEQILGDYHNHSFERLRSNQRPGPSSADAMGGGYLNIPGYENRIVSDRLGMVLEPELDLGKITMSELAEFSPANSKVIVYPYIMPNRGLERRLIYIDKIYLSNIIDKMISDMPAQTPPAGSSASSSITAGSLENAEDMRVISDTLSEMSKLIKGEKSYIDGWLITMKRINRLPVSGETRPVERFFALLNGVAGAVRKATGYNDYDTLIYPCSGADMSSALAFFNLEDTSSQREYRIVTIDRSNIFAGGSSEKEVKREIAEYITAKLGTGTSFGPYRQYIMDYLLDLVLLARRFDPRGNNLDALLDSLRVVDYKKEKNAIVATVTFVVNGHTVRHTHIAYFLKEKLDENNKGDMLVKDVLEQAVSRSGRTILLSKGHAMLLPDLDTSTESLYPLLKNGTVIVSDDPAEQRKLGFSKVEGKLADLKTPGVIDDLAQMQKNSLPSQVGLSSLYWGYARDLAEQLQIFKFEKKLTIKEIAEKFKSGLEPITEEDERTIIEKQKELNFNVEDIREIGANGNLGIYAMILSLLEECGVDSASTTRASVSNETNLAKAAIFKDMRHDLQHVVTALELANLLSGEEISDLNSYETVFAAYPELTQENMMLRELLRWQGLVNLKAEALRRIYDRILMHINKAAQFKSTIDKLVRLDGSQDNSAAQYYLASSRGVDSEFRLFTSTFNRLKNEIDNPGKKEMININSSIKEVVDVYASNYSSYKYNLRLDDRVDSLFIPANALQLSCVWKNLISNAREVAVSNGEISVTSRIVEKEGEKFVEVAFTDNGHPIEENMLAGRRLFREGESSKSKNGGTGLYLVDLIMKNHGAKIEAYSGENGPKFIMDFPVTDSSSSPVGNTDEFLIDLELDTVADSVAQAVADIATGKAANVSGIYMDGVTTVLAKYQGAGLDFSSALGRLDVLMQEKGIAKARVEQLNRDIRRWQGLVEELAIMKKRSWENPGLANKMLTDNLEKAVAAGKEAVVHGTSIENLLAMLASGQMIQGELNNFGKGNYFEIAKSGDSYAAGLGTTEALLEFDRDRFIRDYGLIPERDFITRNYLKDGVVTGYEFFIMKMDLPMYGEYMKYFRLITPRGISNLADLFSSSPVSNIHDVVVEHIRGLPGQKTTFADFMNIVQGHAEYGYYPSRARIEKDAEDGFLTFAEGRDGIYLARAIANRLMQKWLKLGSPSEFTVVEMGAGNGTLSLNILNSLKEQDSKFPPGAPTLYKALRYVIVDISQDNLRMKQEAKLGEFQGKVSWVGADARDLSPLREKYGKITGVFLSNELVDDFGVHRVVIDDAGRPQELYVTVDNDGVLHDLPGPVSDQRINAYVDYLKANGIKLETGIKIAVNLEALAWQEEMERTLDKGEIITIDYAIGDLKEDYYRQDAQREFTRGKDAVWSGKYENKGAEDIYDEVKNGQSVNITSLVDLGYLSGQFSGRYDYSGIFSQAEFIEAGGFVDVPAGKKAPTLIPLSDGKWREMVPFKVLIQTRTASSPLLSTSVHANILEAIMDILGTKPFNIPSDTLLSGKLLNIGMETDSFIGELSPENIVTYLSSQGKDITGLDPSPWLNQKFPNDKKFVRGAVQDMPFPDNSFDTVISIGLFNPEMFNLSEMQKEGAASLEDFYASAAKEIKRVLKPQGKFIVSIGVASESSAFVEVFKAGGFYVVELPVNAFLLINRKHGDLPVSGESASSPASLPVDDIVNSLRSQMQKLPQDFRKEAASSILIGLITESLGLNQKVVYINKSAAELFREIVLDTRRMSESQPTRSRVEQFHRWFNPDLAKIKELIEGDLPPRVMEEYSGGEKKELAGVFDRMRALINYDYSSSPVGQDAAGIVKETADLFNADIPSQCVDASRHIAEGLKKIGVPYEILSWNIPHDASKEAEIGDATDSHTIVETLFDDKVWVIDTQLKQFTLPNRNKLSLPEGFVSRHIYPAEEYYATVPVFYDSVCAQRIVTPTLSLTRTSSPVTIDIQMARGIKKLDGKQVRKDGAVYKFEVQNQDDATWDRVVMLRDNAGKEIGFFELSTKSGGFPNARYIRITDQSYIGRGFARLILEEVAKVMPEGQIIKTEVASEESLGEIRDGVPIAFTGIARLFDSAGWGFTEGGYYDSNGDYHREPFDEAMNDDARRDEEGIVVAVFEKTASQPYLPGLSPEEINDGSNSMGGVDFRALPMTTQQVLDSPSAGVPLYTLSDINLDEALSQIQRMLGAGIIPSSERIKEYAQSCYGRKDENSQINKILVCIAEILRMQEDRAIDTDLALKKILGLLESGETSGAIQLGLAGIRVEENGSLAKIR